MLLEIENLKKYYFHRGKELRILDGMNLSVNQGDTIAVTGESGVGKSTFLHVIGTIDTPTGGTVLFKDRNLSLMNEEELSDFRNQSIGFVFQFHYLINEMSALENVMLPALIGGLGNNKAQSSALKYLTRVGLKDRLSHSPAELSGGEQQRVAVARALVMEPALILADEPTGNLDENTSKEIHELFVELNKETGVSIILATHNPIFADCMKRVLIISNGVFEERA